MYLIKPHYCVLPFTKQINRQCGPQTNLSWLAEVTLYISGALYENT